MVAFDRERLDGPFVGRRGRFGRAIAARLREGAHGESRQNEQFLHWILSVWTRERAAA